MDPSVVDPSQQVAEMIVDSIEQDEMAIKNVLQEDENDYEDVQETETREETIIVDDEETGDEYYNEKITLSKFYIEQLLPLASGYASSVTAGKDDLFNIKAESF